MHIPLYFAMAAFITFTQTCKAFKPPIHISIALLHVLAYDASIPFLDILLSRLV